MAREHHAVLRELCAVLLALGFSQGCKSPSESEPALNAPASCTVDGLTFPHGAHGIPDEDGCNTCDCRDGGLWCTAVACAPESGCRIDGKVYAEGSNDVPDPNSCNCCACESGKIARCSRSACPLPASCRFRSFEYPHGRGFGTELFGCRCEAGSWDCGADRKPASRRVPAFWECPTAPGVSGPDGETLATSKESLRPSMFRVPPDIDQQGFFEDLFMIWSAKKSLPPHANARSWFAQLPRVSPKPARVLGNGAEVLEATAQGQYGTCRWSLALVQRQLQTLSLECSFQRWHALGAAFREALGPAFQIRQHGDRAVARVEYRR